MPREWFRQGEALSKISQVNASKKAIERHYPNGIVRFDSSVFDSLFRREDENEVELHDALEKLKQAKENKDAAQVDFLKKSVSLLRLEKKRIDAEIKEATEKNSVYYRAVKPYLDAEKLIVQARNYSHIDEIIELSKTVN